MTPAHSSDVSKTNAIEVVYVDLPAVRQLLDNEERATPRLSADEEQRAAEMTARTGPHHWRTSRIALRMMLERWAGPSVRSRPYATEAKGRPYLPDVPVHFSLSHTDDAALIAVSGQMIGVDLEAQRAIKMSRERQDRLLTAAARYSAVCDIGDAAGARGGTVLRAWVRLEAVAKATGRGIGNMLTEHGVVGARLRVGEVPTASALDVQDLAVPAGYFAAIAAAHLPEALNVEAFPRDAAALADFLRQPIGASPLTS